MSNNVYTTQTAAFKAVTADISFLNTKRIKVNGTDINDIKTSVDVISQVVANNKIDTDTKFESIEAALKDANIPIKDNRTNPCLLDVYSPVVIKNEETNEITVGSQYLPNGGKWSDDIFYNEVDPAFSEVINNSDYLILKNNILYSVVDEYPTKIAEIQTEKIKNTFYLDEYETESFMFRGMPIKIFDSDLSMLEDGTGGFKEIWVMETFNSNLDSLKIGNYMFLNNEQLSKFNISMNALKSGCGMFGNVYSLKLFSSETPNLIDGSGMFSSCNSLSSFTSNLNSLVAGQDMFSYCKLDAESVMYILYTINDITEKSIISDQLEEGWVDEYHYNILTVYNDELTPLTIYAGDLTIGVGYNNASEFATAMGYSTVNEIIQAFAAKGWSVSFQYNGPVSATYSLRAPEKENLPVYAKLVEVKGTKKTDIYKYVGAEDSTKHYNIQWYHDSLKNEGFERFDSLDAAIEYFNVIPK